MNASAPSHPFDDAAAGYDAAFSSRQLGRWHRMMVWQRFARAFKPGQHVLDLGCGTGEDAVWLAQRDVQVTATDASMTMLEKVNNKAESAGVSDRITTVQLDLATLPEKADPRLLSTTYDGAVSNFGPINCLEDRQPLINTLADVIRPGGKVVLVVMSPLCPWEIFWHLGHLRFRSAFRRFHSGQQASLGNGETIRVWYPSARRLKKEFAPYFRTREVAGIGLLLPTTEMSRLADRAPRVFRNLASVDRRMAGSFPWRQLNDHYLLVLERR